MLLLFFLLLFCYREHLAQQGREDFLALEDKEVMMVILEEMAAQDLQDQWYVGFGTIMI